MRRNYQLVSVVIFTLLFGGCVWEDMTNCDVSLHIKYDYNKDYRDKILEEVDHLDLFIFLADGSLYKQLFIQPKIDGTTINLSLEGGTYHLVAWGNVPPPTHQEVSYRYDMDSNKLVYHGDILDFQDSVRGLFYGTTESFTIDGENKHSREMSLIKNTKHIDVEISGLTNSNCELFAANRSHDNMNIPSIHLDSRPKIDKESGQTTFRFNTHRLLAADADKSGLIITGTLEGKPFTLTPSLIDMLLLNPNENVDLDRFDHYLLKIDIGGTQLAPVVTVNGWTLIDMPEEL